MKLPDWSKRTGAALRGTANLVALTIVGWAAFLTWDKWLAVAGFAIETTFLVWATWSPKYQERLKLRNTKPRPKWIDLWLLFVTVSGFVVILFFGFGKRLLTPRWLSLSHAQGWEAGAIGWTALFLFYYLFKYQDTKRPAFTRALYILLAIVSTLLLILLLYSMEIPILHVFGVLALGVCFLIIDLVLVFQHKSDDEQRRSLASLVGADIPMVTTLSLLLLYLWIYYDADGRDVFVSGVIACQLLFSNAVFVATEFAWLQLPTFASSEEKAKGG